MRIFSKIAKALGPSIEGEPYLDIPEYFAVNFDDAIEVSRIHGKHWGPYSNGYTISTCLILKNNDIFYLVVKNYCCNGCHMERLSFDMGMKKCHSLGEALYYQKQQMDFWVEE